MSNVKYKVRPKRGPLNITLSTGVELNLSMKQWSNLLDKNDIESSEIKNLLRKDRISMKEVRMPLNLGGFSSLKGE